MYQSSFTKGPTQQHPRLPLAPTASVGSHICLLQSSLAAPTDHQFPTLRGREKGLPVLTDCSERHLRGCNP